MIMADTFQSRLHAVEKADSAQGLIDAVEDLSELQDERSILTLIQVLGFNNPGAAVAAVEGLIQIGIPAVTPLLEKLDGYNYGARAWAIRALAGIGDPRGHDLLLDAAVTDFALSVRRAAARGLGNIRWQDLPKEQRAERQEKSQTALIKVTEDEEWVVRYAATVGLQSLAIAQVNLEQTVGDIVQTLEPIINCLKNLAQQDETLAVKARAKWALQQLNRYSS